MIASPSSVCVGIEVEVGIQLVHVVHVIVVGQVGTQIEVLAADDLIVQSKFDTLVGGLTYILVLIDITGGVVDRHFHQNVFGGVPVEVEATTELATPHTEVETEVAGNGGLPHQ